MLTAAGMYEVYMSGHENPFRERSMEAERPNRLRKDDAVVRGGMIL